MIRAAYALIIVLISTFHIGGFVYGYCPCSSQTRIRNARAGNRTICLSRTDALDSLTLITIGKEFQDNLKVVDSNTEVTKSQCNVLVEFTSNSTGGEGYLCPGTCYPIRRVLVPTSFLKPSSNLDSIDYAITCTLTIKQIIAKFHKESKEPRAWVGFLLRSIVHRRLQECSESVGLSQLSEPADHTANTIVYPRRRIDGLVIWIGTMDRYKRMEHQYQVLPSSSFHHSTKAVLGWAASDRLYPCLGNTTRCIGNHRKFAGMLPKSDINLMPAGWGCAQRRPLRSLAHTLLLLDPNYIILLDDDTYLNYPLFLQSLEPLLRGRLVHEEMYLGEAMGRTGDNGHISKLGFFVGGSGYIIGKALLDRLVNKEVGYFGFEVKLQENLRLSMRDVRDRIQEDDVRSVQQIWHLSVLGEGIGFAQKHCRDQIHDQVLPDWDVLSIANASASATAAIPAHPPACNQLDGWTGGISGANHTFAPIAVRLIDYCTNLMANEHTCQHSDHSLGRCLVYGARARPLPVTCHLDGPPSGSPLLGMCFMAPQCDPKRHVTCHRYEARRANGGLAPVRTSMSAGHYKHYSSVLKGNVSDTYQ